MFSLPPAKDQKTVNHGEGAVLSKILVKLRGQGPVCLTSYERPYMYFVLYIFYDVTL